MLSYHNDPAIKEKFVSRFAAHRAADEVIQGLAFEGGQGCFVGCTLHNYDHEQFPKELGWPEWLGHLAEAIFEKIPKSEAVQFGTDLLAAVPVGVDLKPVRFHIAIARHERQLLKLRLNKAPYAVQGIEAIEEVIKYCNLEIEKPLQDHEKARLAAYSKCLAAYSAAHLAADSETYSIANSKCLAAYSKAKSAYSAAHLASDSETYSIANSKCLAAYSVANLMTSSGCSATNSAYSASRSATYSAAADLVTGLAADSSEHSEEYKIERDTLLHVLQNM